MNMKRRAGSVFLAFVLAFALALPQPALAWAALQASGVAAESAGPAGAADVAAGKADASASDAAEPGLSPAEAPSDASADIWDGSIDVSWYSASSKSFTLTKPAQLAGLAAIVNGTAASIDRDTFAGKTVTLGADMQLNATTATSYDASQRSWVPIGNVPLASVNPDGQEGAMPHYTDGNFFDGTFDGAGHVVKNLYIYDNLTGSYGGVQGFFGNVGGNALIQNVGIESGYVYGRVAGGLVAISHVTQEGKVPHIIGCFNKANISCNGSSTRGAGGIFGGEEQYRASSTEDGVFYEANYHGGAYIANCYNWGTVSHVTTSNCSMGGIAGTGSVQIYGCYNRGRVEPSSVYSGSLAGNLVGAGYKVGQNAATSPWEGASAVHDSYALDSSIPADSNLLVKLYNLIDATHTKDGKAEQSPAITNENGPADVKFKAATWFSTADDALSQSFDNGSAGYPELYWQQGRVRWDINAKDSYGDWVYGIRYIDDQPYTGSPVVPEVIVGYYADASYSEDSYVRLHEGSDYLVEFANNTGIGTADLTMTGMGRFTNGRTVHFKIIDGSLTNASIDEILAQWWYGSAVEPDVVVRAGGTVLEEGRDYELEWANNDPSEWTAPVRAGDVPSATATVTAKPLDDKFSGEKSATFTVLRASTSLPGTGSKSDPKQIGSKADLQFLAYKTHTGDDLAAYSDYSYKVTADIDATSNDPSYKHDRPCDPLFTAWGVQNGNSRSFLYGLGGTFDGDGHVITLGQTESGVSFDLEAALALMVYTKSGSSPVVKNLTVDGSVLCPHGAAAGFLVMGQSGSITFENCVNKAEVRGDAYYMGGAAGFVVQTSSGSGGSLTMTKCVNEGSVTSGAGRAGGFVSALGGRSGSLKTSPPVYANTFENCVNRGAVKGGQENGAGGFVAVILGADSPSDASGRTTLFERCANEVGGTVTMTSSGDVGGIVGYSQDAIELLKLDRCSNAATLDGAGTAAIGGGLVGRVYNPAELTNCYNTGDVVMRGSWANNGAGLVGYFAAGNNDSTTLLLQNVYATGSFTGPDEESGGLVGNIFLHTTITLDNAYYDSASASRWVRFDPRDEYPNAVAPPVVNGQATALDAGAMKTETFASQLGVAFGPDDYDTPQNKGFPVLYASDRVVTDLGAGGVELTVTPDPWVYTGAKIRPDVKVQTSSGVLTEGIDYVVFYSSKGDGTTWRAVVQGIGSYTGSVEKTFAVTPCPITSCSISSPKTVSYSDIAGIGATQDITVVNPAGFEMTEGIDYEVAYSHNDEAGIGYMRIEGRGPHYNGSTLRMFTIAKGDLGDSSQVRIENVDEHYPLTYGSSGLYIYEQLYAKSGYKLKRADNAADNGDYGRQFYYADGEHAGQPVLTAGGNAATSLEKAGAYTVRFIGEAVRDLGGGNTEVWTNGNWTGAAEASFTYGNRMEKDCTATGVRDAYEYTGSAIAVEPAFTNDLTDYALVKGVDYTLSYLKDGVEVTSVLEPGDYQVVATGKNDWFGTRVIDFKVIPSEYFIGESAVVEGVSAEYLYSGAAIKPVPSAVKVNGKTLDPATDYSVSYADAKGNAVEAPTEPGTYRLVVSGAMPYEGSKTVEFRIARPFISVYVKAGAEAQPVLAKSYTADQFKALKYDGEAVSALYCDMSGSNWKVASTNDYVVLEDLLDDAGAAWGAGAALTYGEEAGKGATYTYERLQDLMFYPATTATATDALGGRLAPFVLSITDKSSAVGEHGVYASEAQEYNLQNLSPENAPRVIMGVSAGDYANPVASASRMMGSRLVKGVSAITVTLAGSDGEKSGSSEKPDDSGASSSPTGSEKSGTASKPSTPVQSNTSAQPSTPAKTSASADSGQGAASNAAAADMASVPQATVAKSSGKVKGKSVYRLFNKKTGEHFYTVKIREYDYLASLGWKKEGVAWTAPKKSGTAVYRLLNPHTGKHLYSKSAKERKKLKKAGWKVEGVAWYSAGKGGAALYRMFNPHTGEHFYTKSAKERKSLKKAGWRYEGVAWRALR